MKFEEAVKILSAQIVTDDNIYAFKRAIGRSFNNRKVGSSFLNDMFRDIVLRETRHALPNDVRKLLSNFRNNAAGDILHAYAIYYTLLIDKHFAPQIQKIDSAVFGGAAPFAFLEVGDAASNDENMPAPKMDARGKIADPFSDIRTYAEHIIKAHRSEFVGREKELAKIDKFVSDRSLGRNDGLMLITAPAGFGKTALASNWIEDHQQDSTLRIVPFFCSKLFRATTDVERCLRYLAYEMGNPIPSDFSPYSLILSALSQDMPEETVLVIWLDGLDEFDQLLEFFLPARLGKRVAVVISVRSNPRELPEYLANFIEHPLAAEYGIAKLRVPMLPARAIRTLVDKTLSDFVCTEDDRKSAFEAVMEESEGGYPIFVKLILDEITSQAKKGYRWWNARYGTLAKFGEHELKQLKRDGAWHSYDTFFKILLNAPRALTLSECNAILPAGKQVASFELIPYSIRRWVEIDRHRKARNYKETISISHDQIRYLFNNALDEGDHQIALNLVIEWMKTGCRDDDLVYRRLGTYLLKNKRYLDFQSWIGNKDTYRKRVEIFGAKMAMFITIDDIEMHLLLTLDYENFKDNTNELFGDVMDLAFADMDKLGRPYKVSRNNDGKLTWHPFSKAYERF